jgi:hypothetical protein
MTSPVVWQWGDVDASHSGQDLLLVHRYTGARLALRDGRLVRSTAYDHATAAARREVARVGAIVRLRQRGLYFVHAAGAVDPHGRAWLLAGDSGCGKSTLAYALARSGWRILGDDGVLLSVSQDGVTAHGWHAPLEVSSELAHVFPELGEHVSRARRGDLRRRIPMDVPLAREAPAAAMLFVQRSNRHAIVPLGPRATLAALVRQSPWVILDDEYAPAHLDALRQTASLGAFHFAHTPGDLHDVATMLPHLLP